MSRGDSFVEGAGNPVHSFRNVRGEHTGGMEGTRALTAHDEHGNQLGWVRYDKGQKLIENIEVAPEHRGKGVARALLGELHRRHRVGGPRAGWTSTPRTEDGAALLGKLGRSSTPVHPDF